MRLTSPTESPIRLQGYKAGLNPRDMRPDLWNRSSSQSWMQDIELAGISQRVHEPYCNPSPGRGPVWVVCHEHRRSKRRGATCTRDEGGPFEVGRQGQVSNHCRVGLPPHAGGRAYVASAQQRAHARLDPVDGEFVITLRLASGTDRGNGAAKRIIQDGMGGRRFARSFSRSAFTVRIRYYNTGRSHRSLGQGRTHFTAR